MSTTKLVSSTIYSDASAYLLEIALYSKDSATFLINGLPVKNRDLGYTSEEKTFIKNIKRHLLSLGGKKTKTNEYLFSYEFSMENRKDSLEWYLDLLNKSGQIVAELKDLENLIHMKEKKKNKIHIRELSTYDTGDIKMLNLMDVLITSQKDILTVWDKNTYTNYTITLYTASENILTEDKLISEMMSLSNNRVIIVTRKGDIFILDINRDSYELVNVIKLISPVKSMLIHEGRLIVGLMNNSIVVHNHEGEFLTILNKDNIYQSYNIFSMGIFFLEINKEIDELIAISYNIDDGYYHTLIYDLDSLLLKRDISVGNKNITGVIILVNKIYITTLTGEIKIISTNPDELSKINVGGIDKIYKCTMLEDTLNLLLYTNLGLEVISYPDKYYHLDDIKESITKIISTKNKLIIGNSRGDVSVYDFVKGKKKILTKLKDSKITDIIRLENNSLVISNDKGQIVILG